MKCPECESGAVHWLDKKRTEFERIFAYKCTACGHRFDIKETIPKESEGV